ncbi:response regulator transcription factor [Butyrivibrio sp. LC3010]|uniref:response regulator transcription factor n=1 Tax=Butyrivibrio sp. LC3010 TaxID=1280680 RepID=UPI000409C53B|nr:response regulator [Butyrivibrio sp. LC3010]
MNMEYGNQMYKVMIIDDEPIIVEGLRRSVAWDKFGCEVIATAYNGVEGKTLITEKKPDMVFLDICMPEMDGLSMVAALKSEYSNMQVTILTGFRDFEYAKTALNLGVRRFLLKPSNMEEIEEAIAFMVSKLDSESQYDKAVSEVDAEPDLSKAGDRKDADNGSSIGEKADKHEDAANNFIVRNAIAYMGEHYSEKIMLAEVSEKVYVSQWHLSKLLNKEMGQNFSEILNGIRIRKAEEFLKNPSLRIADVAEMVGFGEVNHFSKVFKKINGVSPNEYRNNGS